MGRLGSRQAFLLGLPLEFSLACPGGMAVQGVCPCVTHRPALCSEHVEHAEESALLVTAVAGINPRAIGRPLCSELTLQSRSLRVTSTLFVLPFA